MFGFLHLILEINSILITLKFFQGLYTFLVILEYYDNVRNVLVIPLLAFAIAAMFVKSVK